MSRLTAFAGLVPAVLLLGALPATDAGDGRPQEVVVVNFPETQQVAGSVAIDRPVPSTRLLTNAELVTPAQPTDLASLTEAGVIDATGFASGTLSLSVTLQGTIGAPGKVGALLVPDVPEILSAMRTASVVQFPITVEAAVAPSPSGIHSSTPALVRFAFPRYRVFFYDTTPRSATVTLYTYLGSH